MSKVIKKEAVDESTASFLSGLLDSNQRPLRPERSTLPTALNPERYFFSDCKGTANNLKNKGKNHIFSYRRQSAVIIRPLTANRNMHYPIA